MLDGEQEVDDDTGERARGLAQPSSEPPESGAAGANHALRGTRQLKELR